MLATSYISAGNTGIVTNNEETGYICWASEKRELVEKWKWSHLNEVRPQCEKELKWMMDVFLFKLRFLIFRSAEVDDRCKDGESNVPLHANYILINLFSLRYKIDDCKLHLKYNATFAFSLITTPLGLSVITCLLNFQWRKIYSDLLLIQQYRS